MTQDAIKASGKALDHRWSDDRKIAAVQMAVSVANLTAGDPRAERDTLSVVQGSAQQLMGVAAVKAISERGWTSASKRAGQWLRLALADRKYPRSRIRGDKDREHEQLEKQLGRRATPEDFKLHNKEVLAAIKDDFDKQSVRHFVGALLGHPQWAKALRGLEGREPRTLLEWVAAGAALLANHEASYHVATKTIRIRQRTGICASKTCNLFFFLPRAKDGLKPPTGLAPTTCSRDCKRRADSQERERKEKAQRSNEWARRQARKGR